MAGLVAIAATRAIERWGSATGGLIATLPTTILPASLGVWAAAPESFAAAMHAVAGNIRPGFGTPAGQWGPEIATERSGVVISV